MTLSGLLSVLPSPAEVLRRGDMATPEGRAQERRRRALLTSLTSALAKVTSVAAALASVPLTLHYLGAERYGVWLTMSSFIAMLSFADLGMGNGLLNAVAQAYGRDDRAAIRGLVSSAYAALTGIALLLAAIAAVAHPLVPWPQFFNVRSELAAQEVGPAMAIFLACFAAGIPLGVVQKVQTGLQQGFQSGLWQCGSSLLSLAALLAAIRMEAGLPTLVLALCAAPLAVNAANGLVFFWRSAPDLRPSLGRVGWASVSQIARSGALFLVLQTVIAAAFNSDNLVVTQLLGASSVAELAVPAQMFGLISTVLNIALAPLWPAYGEAIARGDHDWVKRTLYHSLLLSTGLAAIGGGSLLFAGPSLLALWIGKEIDPPFALMLGLAVWKTLDAGGNAIAMFLNGANIVHLQIITASLTGLLIVLTKVLLVERIGLVGIPWATAICYFTFTVIPQAVYLLRLTGPRFFRR